MNQKIVFCLGLMTNAAYLQAADPKVLTVNNQAGSVAMYTTVQAAINAAAPGDTILIAGSPHQYDGISVTKRLNLVGGGYLIEGNDIPGLNRYQTTLGGVSFSGDGEGNSTGSTITGIASSFSNWLPSLGEIRIDKCAGSVTFSTPVKVTRSYCSADLQAAGSSIQNSIIRTGLTMANGTTAANCLLASTGGTFLNMGPQASLSSFVFVVPESGPNQVNVQGSITHSVVASNPSVAGQRSFLPTGGGNIPNIVPMGEILARGENWTDGQLATFINANDSVWTIAPNSVAKGTGLNGVDMGAFGGLAPYVLSGLPSRPRITRFLVPALVSDDSTLKFEVDAQAF